MRQPLGTNEFKNVFFRRQLLCEFIGSFILMLVRKIATTVESTEWAVIKVAFALGFTIAVLTKLFGRISGCHINPAVSIAFFVVGDMSTIRLFFYIIMQTLGSIASVIFYNSYAVVIGNSAVEISSLLQDWQRLLLELILTTMYIMLFRTMANPYYRTERTSSSVAIGMAYAGCLLSGTSISQVTLNPVLHFSAGSNLFKSDWIPAIGSTLGGVVGAVLFEFLYMPYTNDRSSVIFE